MKHKPKGSEDLRNMRDPKSDKAVIQIIRTVGNGHKVTGPFYNGIKKGVRQMMPFLQDYTVYSSADLLGFWSELNSAEIRMAELVIAEQVRRGEYALRAATLGANGPTVFVKLPK